MMGRNGIIFLQWLSWWQLFQELWSWILQIWLERCFLLQNGYFIQDLDTENTKEDYNNFNYNNYCEFNDSYCIIITTHLNDNDIANHIKEITKDVTSVVFDKKLYFYKQPQMVVHSFNNFFQGIIDDDIPIVTLFWFG